MNDNIKLSIEDMNLFYGNFHALKDINMHIPEKEITGGFLSLLSSSTTQTVINMIFKTVKTTAHFPLSFRFHLHSTGYACCLLVKVCINNQYIYTSIFIICQ